MTFRFTPMIVAFAAFGCMAPTPIVDAGPQDPNALCEELLHQANLADASLENAFNNPCAVDDDCEIDPGYVFCSGGAPFDSCEVAIAKARRDEFLAAQEAAYDEVCATDCRAHFDCFLHTAYCEDGFCRGTDLRPEQYCPSLLDDVVRRADDVARALRGPCSDDDDCALAPAVLECDEHFRMFARACEVAVLATEVDAFISAFQASAAERCTYRGFACEEIATCDAVRPECVAAMCEAVVVAPADAG